MTAETSNSVQSDRYVKVLYDYEYTDEADKNKVHMGEDEVFYLLNTDSHEWWQVSRLEDPENPFYVPSTYVEILNSGNDNSLDGDNTTQQTGHNGSDLSNTNNPAENTKLNTFNNNVKMHDQGDSDDPESDYQNVTTYKMPEGSDLTVHYVHPATRPTSDIGEYANLDVLREAANMPQPLPEQPTSPQLQQESDYANVEELRLTGDQKEPSTPDVENCEFKQTLTDQTRDTWDQYLDPTNNRLFYIHNTTKEIQWKPPRRGQFHNELQKKQRLSAEDEDSVFIPPPQSQRKSRSVDFGISRMSLEMNVPEGWSYNKNKAGKAVFIDNATQQQRSGGSSPTKSPTSDPEDQFGTVTDQPPIQKATLTERPRKSQVSDRFNKSRSVMIEHLNFAVPPHSIGQQGPKSATLPPNFTSSTMTIPEVQLEEQVSRRGSGPDSNQSQLFSVNLNEPIEGVLNRCILTNGKKAAKKWQFSYVKLSESNLLIYKEQKATSKSQPTLFVPLSMCSVEKDPKITSKKNVICITHPDNHILLQADDDAKIQEWFIKIHTKILSLGGTPDRGPQEGATLQPTTPENGLSKKPSFKKHSRNNSEGGTLEKKGKVKDKIKNFLANRSEKEKLVKKGIYKDAVFGSEIKQLCDKEKSKVPNFVVHSIEAIEKRGLDHEGLYRVGGNVSQIQKLRCMVDQGEAYDLDDQQWDVGVLSGCLKLFFRELKEPLFTYALFDRFLKGFLKENAMERLKAVKACVNELPKCNYETVKYVFKHLTNVMANSLENKMQAHQLAIVFGPTLIWPEIQSKNLATSMVYQSRIVEFILLEYKNIFK